jgi:glycerophosphoryl diester phosphodiesterase
MQIANKEPFIIGALAGYVWRDFLRARGTLYVFEILFESLKIWLLVPAIAVVLSAIVSGAGHIAVSNEDILDFMLTPLGLLYAALFSTVTVALLLLQQAGIMLLAALPDSAGGLSIGRVLRAAFPQTLRIVQLGAVQAALLALALAPFVLLAVLTYGLVLSEHDIYFYWKARPPAFWLAVGIGGVLLAGALTVAAWLAVRWAFALPILLFENKFARSALRASRERVRGAGWRVGCALFGWLGGVLALGAVLEVSFRLLAAAVLGGAGERPTVLIVLLLVGQAGLIATVSFFLVVGLALLTRRLYLVRSEQLGVCPGQGSGAILDSDKPVSPWNRRLAWFSLLLCLLMPLAVWTKLSSYVTDRPPVQVTAHRGHARAAPENTLSAMRKAIESGADYAEMDVQLTADGKIVLLHDRDFKRVAGVSRRLSDLSYDEVRRLDVGSWFAPAFAGERAPTLAEVISLCRGKIRLNIELKFFGPDHGLAQAVADLIRDEAFESDCLITSLNYDALLELKRHNAALRTGLTVAHALGDVSRLEVDALSVRADFLSDELLHAGHRSGKEVHVWTVNDPAQMTRQIKRGVDNIITSDPDLAIRVRNEWASLTGPERLLLASRLLLGLEP